MLYLIRGLPGSGKSTIASKLAANRLNTVHLEADDFFMMDGVYTFDPKKLSEAHKQCKERTERFLSCGYDVVVANTFIRYTELVPYIDIARRLKQDIVLIRATGNYKSIHNVPEHTIERMRRDWDSIELALSPRWPIKAYLTDDLFCTLTKTF